MNFERFDTLDGERATVLINKVADAIKADIKAQMRKVSRTKYNKWIDNAYNLSNSNALRYGHTIGQKIIDGIPLAKGNGYIKGSDLAKIIYYCLHNEGSLPWLNLRNEIEEAGEPITQLLLTNPISQEDVVGKVEDAKNKLRTEYAEIASSLRRFADQVEPLASVLDDLTLKSSRQGLTIVNQSNTIMAQREKITTQQEIIQQLKDVILRLKTGIQNERDPENKAVLVEEVENLEKRLREVE